MDFGAIVCIALGLAMDAFAVAIASGVIIKNQRQRHALRFGLSFGLFQMFMPVVGWSAGLIFRPLVSTVDHFIAFGLLSAMGIKMIYEALQLDEWERSERSFTVYVLLGLSIATSIDALVIGMSFAFLNISIVKPVMVIGVITFFLTYMGIFIGNKFGKVFENKIEILGGLILIGIGFKILIEHLRAGAP